MLNVPETNELALWFNDVIQLNDWRHNLRSRPDESADTPDEILEMISEASHDMRLLEIIGIASHDIRGGLVSSAGALKLLQRGYYGKMDQGALEEIKKLSNRINGLIELVEDSFGKSQYLAGKLDSLQERLDLKEDVVDLVLDEISDDIQDYGITVINGFSVTQKKERITKGNKFLLKAVFRNLIQNAIRYGENGSRVAIGFRNRLNSFLINVYNSGNPIPREYRDHLFNRTDSLSKNHTNNTEGMGVGLYYVKKIIEKHGGDIWYEAKKRGSNFVFTLPRY